MPNKVVQIGVFDRSSAEFAGRTPKQPANFHLNSPFDYRVVSPKAKPQIPSAREGHFVPDPCTPYGWVARRERTETNTPKIAPEVLRLFERENKIEFVEDLNKKDLDINEAVYFAFPLAMDHPQFQREI